MRSRNYYIVRGIVRTIFWIGVALASLAAIQLFIVAVWSLQF